MKNHELFVLFYTLSTHVAVLLVLLSKGGLKPTPHLDG
jgi:hypothetical protein